MSQKPTREDVLRNPTLEGALALWPYRALGAPMDDTVPLAGVHKARLVWPGSTKKMIRESKRWLRAHGYGTTFGEPDPHCPQAASVGKRN